MLPFYYLLSSLLPLLGLTDAGQEAMQLASFSQPSPALESFAPAPGSSLTFAPVASPSELPSNPPFPPLAGGVLPPLPPLRLPRHHHRRRPRAPAVPVYPPPAPTVPIDFPPFVQPLPQPPAVEPPPTPGCAVAPAPGAGEGPKGGLWCVAKPTVPEEKLQEALDYACGEGGADCEAIAPEGSCYDPDTAVAHASYAFNSYWQKAKQSGGTCSFDGTAILIDSDPSYQECHFILN